MVKYYIFVLSKEKAMAGRPKIYDEETILEKAVEVFWDKGYENASADELLKAMGIGKGSFYLAFKGGKSELFEKTMDRMVTRYFQTLARALTECENPIQLLKDFFYSLVGEESPLGDRGCYFGNAMVQLADHETALRSVAKQHLQQLQRIFTKAVERGQSNKQVSKDTAPAALGLYLLNLWNGINITKQMVANKDELRELIEMNLSILG